MSDQRFHAGISTRRTDERGRVEIETPLGRFLGRDREDSLSLFPGTSERRANSLPRERGDGEKARVRRSLNCFVIRGGGGEWIDDEIRNLLAQVSLRRDLECCGLTKIHRSCCRPWSFDASQRQNLPYDGPGSDLLARKSGESLQASFPLTEMGATLAGPCWNLNGGRFSGGGDEQRQRFYQNRKDLQAFIGRTT